MPFTKEDSINIKKNWGPMSLFPGFCYTRNVDENYVEEYTEQVLNSQNHQLNPLKCDLADWINRTIGISYLNGSNLLHELDNGALLCHLAQVIKARAKIAIIARYTNKSLPKIRDKYFENAMPRSFFSRDNMENFINFCRSLGVHENLLFESDDLVLHNRPKNVILCLLEVARLATNYGIEPPNLIQLEKEMSEQEKNALTADINSQICWQFQSLPSRFEYNVIRQNSPILETITYKKCNSNQLIPYNNKPVEIEESGIYSLPQLPSTEINPIDNDQCSRSSKTDSFTYFETKIINESKEFDELDRRVEQAAQLLHSKCRCINRKYLNVKIRKLGEGKYMIAGRNVLVRLLKDHHMMVRVGGGWDTLDNFLKRHDPCQVKTARSRVVEHFSRLHDTMKCSSSFLDKSR